MGGVIQFQPEGLNQESQWCGPQLEFSLSVILPIPLRLNIGSMEQPTPSFSKLPLQNILLRSHGYTSDHSLALSSSVAKEM